MKIEIGQQVSLTRTVTEDDIENFADISLDRNPVHFDDEFAAKSYFKKRIAHGMIGAALVSGCLTELVGAGNIWLSASYKFQKPTFVGDKLTSTLTLTDINRQGVISMSVEIKNQDSDILITGEVQSMRFTN